MGTQFLLGFVSCRCVGTMPETGVWKPEVAGPEAKSGGQADPVWGREPGGSGGSSPRSAPQGLHEKWTNTEVTFLTHREVTR